MVGWEVAGQGGCGRSMVSLRRTPCGGCWMLDIRKMVNGQEIIGRCGDWGGDGYIWQEGEWFYRVFRIGERCLVTRYSILDTRDW